MPPGAAPASLLVCFMLLMMVCPFIVRSAERSGRDALATAAAYSGYTWLGLVFLFVSGSLLFEAYGFVLYPAEVLLNKDLSAASLSAPSAFFAPLAMPLCVAFYGNFEARNIRTERVTLRTSKLPEGVNRLRIVQISDVHLGLIVSFCCGKI